MWSSVLSGCDTDYVVAATAVSVASSRELWKEWGPCALPGATPCLFHVARERSAGVAPLKAKSTAF
jgi:hypothetical protein